MTVSIISEPWMYVANVLSSCETVNHSDHAICLRLFSEKELRLQFFLFFHVLDQDVQNFGVID